MDYWVVPALTFSCIYCALWIIDPSSVLARGGQNSMTGTQVEIVWQSTNSVQETSISSSKNDDEILNRGSVNQFNRGLSRGYQLSVWRSTHRSYFDTVVNVLCVFVTGADTSWSNYARGKYQPGWRGRIRWWRRANCGSRRTNWSVSCNVFWALCIARDGTSSYSNVAKCVARSTLLLAMLSFTIYHLAVLEPRLL